MSGYIGRGLGQGQSQFFTFTATAGQTVFSGTDDNKYTLNYSVGFIEVFLNGRRLSPGADYTATDGSSITLLAATNASDVINVTATSAFSTADWVTNAVNYVYVATASQTTFSGLDSNSQTLSYVSGTIIVSVNGVIVPQSDYTALNGTSVILASGVNAGDIVQIFALRTLNAVSISNWITNNLTNIVAYTYIATQGQTTFSGSAYAGGSLAYAVGCIEVTVNGLRLTPADYTATNGTSVVLNVGCNADDTVVIWVYSNTTVAGVYTQAQSDAKYMVNNGPAFHASLSGNQAISSSTFTKVNIGVEYFDTGNMYDSTTNYRFTPTVAGYYQFSWAVSGFNTTSPTRCFGSLYKNGAVWMYGSDIVPSQGVATSTGSGLVYMNGSTDYVELYAYITATSPLVSSLGNAPTYTYLSGFLARLP